MAMVASSWPTVMSSKANGLMTKLMGLATIITQKEPLTKENGTKTMTDSYHDDFMTASEYLRLALPFLSQHKIPASPLNYQVGYDYVSGGNSALKNSHGLLRAPHYAGKRIWRITPSPHLL